MTEVPPAGGEGAPDQNQEPSPASPPAFPGGYPAPADPTPAFPGGYPPPAVPPPAGSPSAGFPTPPGFMPPPQAGTSAYGAPGPSPAPSYASYGARLGGWLIDFVILTVVAVIVSAPFHAVHRQYLVRGGMHTFRYRPGLTGVLIDAVLVIVYGGLLCGLPRGQTIGMMATRIRVVRAESGAPIGFPRAFGRAAFEYLMVVALYLPWVLDMLFPLWDPMKQTLHDKVASTVVITT